MAYASLWILRCEFYISSCMPILLNANYFTGIACKPQMWHNFCVMDTLDSGHNKAMIKPAKFDCKTVCGCFVVLIHPIVCFISYVVHRWSGIT